MNSFLASGAGIGFLFLLLAAPLTARAADSAVGAWVSRNRPANTLTIETYGAGGRALTYRLQEPGKGENVIRIESRLDGSDAEVLVNGKPSGQTIAIKRVDARRTTSILKMNGQPYGTSGMELSPDGKVLTVTNEIKQDESNDLPAKMFDIWDRKP